MGRRAPTAQLARKSGKNITVRYTLKGTKFGASIPSDLRARTRLLTFPKGTTKVTFPIYVVGDKIDERNEIFSLAWSRAVNVRVPSKTSITIVDDDGLVAPVIASFNPASPSPNANPRVLGTAPAGSTVQLFASAACTGTPIEATAAAFASPRDPCDGWPQHDDDLLRQGEDGDGASSRCALAPRGRCTSTTTPHRSLPVGWPWWERRRRRTPRRP